MADSPAAPSGDHGIGAAEEAESWHESLDHDEGEGERTREWWLEAHQGFWQRSCARMGIDYSDSLEVVFERFVVVWPPELADPEPS